MGGRIGQTTTAGAATHPFAVQVFHAVLTTRQHHRTRCRLILETWGSVLPDGHLLFYSNAPDASLPIVAHKEPANMSPFDAAQTRIMGTVMPHAAQQMHRLNCTWLFWSDDDTWIWPENLYALLSMYQPQRDVWLGQACQQQKRRSSSFHSYCGGAGFAMSAPLVRRVAALGPRCAQMRGNARLSQLAGWRQSDYMLAACWYQFLRIIVTDRREFNSQSPYYYLSTDEGRQQRPAGFGRAVTFHYLLAMQLPNREDATAEGHFRALWLLSRAAAAPLLHDVHTSLIDTRAHTGRSGKTHAALNATRRRQRHRQHIPGLRLVSAQRSRRNTV